MGGGRQVSHGRGGAGNISSNDKAPTTDELVTPTIKQEIFTTGRGGSGNMRHKDPNHPELARESQDVESPPQRSDGSVHFTGRGGVANAYIPTSTITTGTITGEQQQRRGSRAGIPDAQPPSHRTSSKDRTKEAAAVTTGPPSDEKRDTTGLRS